MLVADDNADLRAYISDVLSAEFAVTAVPDGATALHVALDIRPDLVLADVMMPGLDGFALLEALRSDRRTAATPVVMISARAGEEAVVHGLEVGADDYICKPFASSELLARVRSTIALNHARKALADAESRREADARLLRAEERYRHAGHAAQVGTWSADLDDQTMEVDTNLEDLLGALPGSIRSLGDFTDLIAPEDRERFQRDIARTAPADDEVPQEFRVTRPDGHQRVFHWRASTADGADTTVFGAAWDATALSEAQTAIRESEQAAPAGIAIIELNGTITRANRALGGLLDVAPGDLPGRAFADLIHPDDDPPLGGETSGPVSREVRLLRANGEEVWAVLSVATVMDAGGRPRHLVVHVQDARERKRFERDLQYLADHDALTDLWNRRRFGEELDRALVDAQRYGTRGALLLFDVDGFKHVNDTLGHAVGDELLIAVADVLRDRLRQSDIPSRIGGDEFAVLAPHADEEAARTLGIDLLRGIASTSPLASAAGIGALSASVGVALFGSPEDVSTADDLLIEADIALYAAKESGAGRLSVRTPADRDARAPNPARSRWGARIRSALDDGRFVLHAQPIVALQDDPVPRWELLLRMRPEKGDDLLAPTAFLPTAERSPLIQEIDRWVVRSAIQDLAAHAAAGDERCYAVNLSAKSIVDPGMGAYVLGELDAAGVDGGALVLEVTETAAIVNLERAREFVRTIVAGGCRLALDDFGAGFTSFHYLKHLDFAIVKIDGAFISNLAGDPTSQSLVRALSDMARSLGKLTVAECVGDDATVEWLRDLGVDHAQGFHLGRPVPLDSLSGVA